MRDDAWKEIRRSVRRDYLRRHEQARRAADRENGARRIDVTLKDDMLDNYATVRRYFEAIERIVRSSSLKKIPPRRRPISDTEVITQALKMAANTIWENENEARRSGMREILADPPAPPDA